MSAPAGAARGTTPPTYYEVSNQSALAEERTLRLVPPSEMYALDLTPDHDRSTPLLLGTIDESSDWTTPGDTMIRYATTSGAAAIFNAPAFLLTPKVRAVFHDLMAALDEASAMRSLIGG